ncbi:MAG: DUF4199 domain-containing protein [Chitinophagaceae bacterium]
MKAELKSALGISIAGFIWVVLEYVFGLHSTRINLHSSLTWLAIVPIIFFYIIHFRDLNRNSAQKMTFKKGFLSGMMVTLFSIPLSQIGFLLYYYLINPNFFTAFRKYTVENNFMSPTEADQYFTLRNYLIQISAGSIFMGIVLTLILTLIFSSKKKH